MMKEPVRLNNADHIFNISNYQITTRMAPPVKNASWVPQFIIRINGNIEMCSHGYCLETFQGGKNTTISYFEYESTSMFSQLDYFADGSFTVE